MKTLKSRISSNATASRNIIIIVVIVVTIVTGIVKVGGGTMQRQATGRGGKAKRYT